MGDDQWARGIRSMNESRESGAFVDFKIIVHGVSVHVNRIHLYSHCDYFKEHFKEIAKDQTHYELEEGYDVESVKQCVHYMYTGNLGLSKFNTASVLRLGYKWGMTGVKTNCERFMLANMNPTVCVEWVKVAMLCDLPNLESTGLRYIMQHIFQVTDLYVLNYTILDDLIKTVDGEMEKIILTWNAVKARIRQQSGGDPCDLINNFPVELLPSDIFNSSVLDHEHLHMCSACREEVTQRRKIHHDFKLEDLRGGDCFRMKKLALKYGAYHVVPQIDGYITSNFKTVCMEPEFLRLVTEDDLLRYIGEIDVECTPDEFDRILLWMRQEADRHSLFPIVISSATSSGAFQRSWLQLRNFIRSDNCCFLMNVTEKYSSESLLRVQEHIDSFIHKNFSSVANSEGIAILSATSMQRYASRSDLCGLEEGRVMCNVVKNWANSSDRGVEELERLFQIIPLTRFSLTQLLEMTRFFAQIFSACYCKLLKVIISKLAPFLVKLLFLTVILILTYLINPSKIYEVISDVYLDDDNVERTSENEDIEDTVCSAFGSFNEPCAWIAQYLLLK